VSHVDWFALIAADRGMPENWRWSRSEVKGEKPNIVFLVEGAIPGGVFARGKNKGKHDPKKYTERAEIVITHAELKARRERWEQETGRCSECFGDGTRCTGSTIVNGAREEVRSPCKRCSSTGKANLPGANA
jgi:hypothetical protein